MKRFVAMIMVAVVAMAAEASFTTHLKLDCRTGVRVPSGDGENLQYDASWYENGEEVRITDNDIVVTNGTAGSFAWHPKTDNSTPHTLKLEVLSNGEVIATETAQFALGYIRNVMARQLWPHKKVEVCYTLAEDIGELSDEDDEVVLTSSEGNVARQCVGDRSCTPGRHCVVWDMEEDGISRDVTNLSVSVSVMNGTPGFVTKTFSSSSLTFDKTSDVWSGTAEFVERPDGLYVTSLAEHTTLAYGCYMWMVGGVTYSFKGRYDDFVGVKVGSNWIMSNSSECQEASGSYTPSTSGCYPVEFRVGNNGGAGGCQSSSLYGIKWCTSENGTWRNVENTASENVFFARKGTDAFKTWTGTSSMIPVNISSHVKDGMTIDETTRLVYTPIDADSVSLAVNGEVVHSATEDGTFDWLPTKPGTYVLTHRAGTNEWRRNVICTNAANMSQLEIGWSDGPVSNLFPNVYATVTNVVIATTVTNIPANAFAGCVGLGSGVVIRDGCVLCVNGECPADVILPEGTRLLADGAFRNCSTLTSVSIPEGCKSIGAYAFANCTELERVDLPEGVETIGEGAFENCTWIQQVEFPSTLKSIGNMAFANCSQLQGVECFDGLETIGEGAFSNCWHALSVSLPTSVDVIGALAFCNCKNILGVTIPAHVDTMANLFPDVYEGIQSVVIAEGETELVPGLFCGCALLEEVALSDEIEEIPDSTFEGCSEMRRIVFPSNLVRIGNRAFYGCEEIRQLEFPEGLEEIGDDAFNGVQQVRDLICPSSVITIGARAFKGVWNDAGINLPAGLESLGAEAFADCPAIRKIELPAVTTPIKSAFPAAYAKIESVKILGAPEEIPAGFCQDVASLSGVTIPSSVTNIGNHAFAGLSNLAAIDLPPNLALVGEYAFQGDSRLTEIAIPQSVTSVGYRAFYGCGNIRTVSCPGAIGTMSELFPSAYGEIAAVTVNAGTTYLMDDLLSGCAKLSEIDLPAGITNIGARAFKNCSSLASFGVPQGVVGLGSDVFSGCTGLASVSLPEGLARIPSGAFRNCSAISSIVIPASVEYLEADAFNGCTALKSISYLGSAPGYDSGCYGGTAADLSSYVILGSRGWDGVSTSKALPEYWPTVNSRTIGYWTPNTFDATFDANGGTPATTSVVQTTGMTYALPAVNPTMAGARFNGWWTERVNGGRIKSTTKVGVTRAQTFYAHWKYNAYAVRFDANGGFGEMEDLEMTVNAVAALSDVRFQRKGCQFAGWSSTPDGAVEYADGAEVGNLTLEHGSVVTLYAVWTERTWDAADYLNVSGRAFAFGGDAGWIADDAVSHDGVGSMRSGVIAAALEEGDRTTSVLSTTVTGSGAGSFWWKVDCEPAEGSDYYDYCSFSIDDVVVTNIAGKIDWEKIAYEVTGSGEHILKWTFARDDYDEDETRHENAAWVDEFAWAPTPVTLSFGAGGADGEVPDAVTKYAGYSLELPGAAQLSKAGFVFAGWSDGANIFAAGELYAFGPADAVLTAVWREKVWTLTEAANVTNAILTTGGSADWVVDLTTNYDGAASIRSGTIGHSQETWTAMTVSDAGTIAFRVLVSGEYNRGRMCDYLKFEVDGTEAFSSYDAEWSNVVVAVSGSGEHTFKWTYLKNASKSVGFDCAWIDEIVWTPNVEPTDPIPDLGENPTADEIANVFAGAKAEDPMLADKITNGTEYAAFREWSGNVKQEKDGVAPAGAAAVMAAPNAWVSYALGSETLIEKAPTDADLTVEAFEPKSGADGKFDFTVSVKDVEVGSTAAAENLKQVFGLEGGTSLESGKMSSANVDITFGTPQDGKVKFTAGPNAKNADAKAFFMKVRMKP